MPWPSPSATDPASSADRSLHLLEKVLKSGNRTPDALDDPALGPIIKSWSDKDISVLSEQFKNQSLAKELPKVLEHPRPSEATRSVPGHLGAVLQNTPAAQLETLAKLWNQRSAECMYGRVSNR
jgi:hypothetical protein